MPKNSNITFVSAQQNRSKKTLEDIIESAHEIVESANPDRFTSRALSNRSGYSLGTLSKRLGSIENVFLWVIQKGQKKNFENFAQVIEDFDSDKTLQDLVEHMIDITFKAMRGVNPKVIGYLERNITKNNGITPNFYSYVDVLVKPYIETALKNKTNTFRQVSENEAKLIFRATLIFTERPFVDLDPIAGTKEHRKIAIDNLVRLLSK